MSDQKKPRDPAALKIHVIGAIICLAIAGGSIWFAADSISNRRGLFLSARHELTTVRSELDQAVDKRTSLASRVRMLEELTSDALELSSVKLLNKRTAEISRLAESVGISVDTLMPGEMIKDARVPVQPLELVGTADAGDVSVLLDELSVQMPDMHIQLIDIRTESFDSAQVRIQFSLYWFVDPADKS
jgi:hypothetical protein